MAAMSPVVGILPTLIKEGDKSGLKSIVPSKINVLLESERVKTFAPVSKAFGNILIAEFAACGLYYICDKNAVKCPFCIREFVLPPYLSQLKNILQDHKKLSNCSYMRNYFRTCLKKDQQNTPNGGPNMNFVNTITAMSRSQASILPENKPKFPDYSSITARLETFNSWPLQHIPQLTKQHMADAGFYFRGEDDKVWCFQCGILLGNWELADDPWIEHARWSPCCSFVLITKGLLWLQDILNNLEPDPLQARRNVSTNDKKSEDTDNKAGSEDDEKLCKICFANDKNTALVPCGHVICCTNCADKVDKCPVCRRNIQQRVRLVYS